MYSNLAQLYQFFSNNTNLPLSQFTACQHGSDSHQTVSNLEALTSPKVPSALVLSKHLKNNSPDNDVTRICFSCDQCICLEWQQTYTKKESLSLDIVEVMTLQKLFSI